MSFSFDATAGASQSTTKPRLAGNEIHTVKFDGCEIQDIQGVKDTSVVYKVLKFRFSNEDGYYEHTIFEPKQADFARGESEFTNKNGNKEKIPQPSNVESMMLFFKHFIDAFVPTVAKEIDDKTKKITAPSWEELRNLVAKIALQGKDKVSNIKLVKDKEGNAKFPGFFAGLTKEGKPYVKNNFIGAKVAFTAYENGRISGESNARITNMNSSNSNLIAGNGAPEADDLDLSFEVGNDI